MDNLSKKTKVTVFILLIFILASITFVLTTRDEIRTSMKKEQTNKLALEMPEKVKIEIDIKEETENAYKCLLIFTSNDENNKIKSIEYPEEDEQEPNIIQIAEEEGKQKIAIDYELQKNDIQKRFKVKTKDNEIVIKQTAYDINLHYNDESNTIVNKKFLVGKEYRLDQPPIKDGYVFVGWSNDKNSRKCNWKETYKQETDKDVDLYAIIVVNKSLTIHYLSGYDSSGYIQTVQAAETTSVTLEANKFTRAGYTFMYWKDVTSEYDGSKTGGTESNPLKSGGYYDVVNNLVKILDEDWETDIFDIIEENLDYKEDPEDPDDAPNVATQTRWEILDYLEPEKVKIQRLFSSGMTMEGLANWMVANQSYLHQLQEYEYSLDDSLYEEDDEEEEEFEGTRFYNSQQNIDMKGKDMWLEAAWTNTPITLNANGGTIDEQNSIVVSLKEGQEYGDEMIEPDREDYVFVGWFTSASGGTQKVETDIYTPSDLPGKTLYAHWKKDDPEDPTIVQITFDGNSGKLRNKLGNEVTTITLKKVQGAKYGTMPEAEKENEAFVGWYTEPEEGVEITPSTTVTNSVTLYAHYKELEIVKLDMGNEEEGKSEYFHRYTSSTTIENRFNQWNPVKHGGILVVDGRKIGKQAGGYQLPSIARGIKRSLRRSRIITTSNGTQRKIKSKFKGWYTEPNGKGTIIRRTDRYYDSYGKTLYANWKEPKVITFNANGGKFGNEKIEKQKYNKYIGQKYPIISKPKKVGYTLVGWYDSEVGGNKIELGNINNKIEGDKTLYAHWEDKTPPKKFTVSVSGLSTSGFTINVSRQEDLGTGVDNIKYYVNTSTSGSTNQTSNKVTGLGDSEIRYVWAVITDKAGNSRRSTNYVKVVMPHTHNDSCYRMSYANYSCKAGNGNYKTTITRGRCRWCYHRDSRRERGWIDTNYNYDNGNIVSLHPECGGTTGMEYDPNDDWSAKEFKVYIMCCPQCGHNIFDKTDNLATGWKCRHTVGKQLYCTKNTSGTIASNNF